MSTTNNLRSNSIANRGGGGLKPALMNRNISNIRNVNNNINTKKLALSQSTNTLINSKLSSKLNSINSTNNNNIIKKPLVSITENENVDLKKKKSKIPKFSSPAKSTTQAKQLKRDQNSTIQSSLATETSSTTTTTTTEKLNLIKFSSFKLPSNVENIDINDHTNVLLAPGFSNDIYMYLNHLENKLKIQTSNFLQIQKTMNHKMRARLVDWIIAVHHKFKLLPETLYLTIAIMDRYFERCNVDKDKVQLVGLTAFFIACKYEEIYPPEIADFIKLCDAYTKNNILDMEKTMLKAIDFNLSYPLPLHFLRRFSKAAHADQEIHTLAKYLMELGLVEYECSSWKPSLLAAASLYLTLNILATDHSKTQWTNTLAFYTNYKESDLLKPVSYLCQVLLRQSDSKLQTTKSKYANPKLLRISDNPKLISEYVVKMSKMFK